MGNNFDITEMGCCCPGKTDYKPERMSAVESNRTCTDLPCLITYLGFFAAMIWITFYGWSEGDLRNIAQPFDVDSNRCGHGTAKDFPYLFFTEKVLNYKDVKGTVCVSECHKKKGQAYACLPNSAVANCAQIAYFPTTTWFSRFCVADVFDSAINKIKGKPASVLTQGAQTMDDAKKNAVNFNDGIFKAIKIPEIDGWFEDIADAWWVITICCLLAFAFGFLYLWLVDLCARVITYTFIVLFYVS